MSEMAMRVISSKIGISFELLNSKPVRSIENIPADISLKSVFLYGHAAIRDANQMTHD